MVSKYFVNIFYAITLLDICCSSIAQQINFHYKLIRLPFIDFDQLAEDPEASKSPFYLPLEIFGKNFIVSLYRGTTVFTPDALIVIHQGDPELEDVVLNANEFKTELVEGWVVDHQGSHVHGYIDDGIFNGVINVDGERYFMESARKYLNGTTEGEAIVYRGSDFEMWPDRISRTYRERNNTGLDSIPNKTFCKVSNVINEVNKNKLKNVGEYSSSRRHRPDYEGLACKMKIVADHWFVHDSFHNSVKESVKAMEFHIKEASKMFEVTDFDGNNRPDEVHIHVGGADVYTKPRDRKYYMSDPKLDATMYLEKFSYYDHSRFCGAMAFSYRVFPESVLGYAYRGGPNKIGGICFKRMEIQGRQRSMNVGMVSFLAERGPVPLAQSVIVVTHELGHMFGSPHDEDIEGGACFRPNEDEHYIMSSMANPGKSSMNRKFSSCSIKMIMNNINLHGDCLFCKGRDCDGATITTAHWSIIICTFGSFWLYTRYLFYFYET